MILILKKSNFNWGSGMISSLFWHGRKIVYCVNNQVNHLSSFASFFSPFHNRVILICLWFMSNVCYTSKESIVFSYLKTVCYRGLSTFDLNFSHISNPSALPSPPPLSLPPILWNISFHGVFILNQTGPWQSRLQWIGWMNGQVFFVCN